MPDYTRSAYADRTNPAVHPELITMLEHHLRQHGIKPEGEKIRRVLERRGIVDCVDMQEKYGTLEKFRAEYSILQ